MKKHCGIICFGSVALLLLTHAATAATTLQFWSARDQINGGLTNGANGVPTNGMPWAVVIDMASTNVGGVVSYDFSALASLSHSDIDITQTNQYLAGTSLRYMIGAGATVETTTDVAWGSGVLTGGVTSVANMVYDELMYGKAFAIIWFPDATFEDNVWKLGSHLGYYTTSGFTIRGDNTLTPYASSYNAGLTNQNGDSNFIFVPFIPEPSTYAAILAGAILTGVALRRRRMNARQASATVAC